MSGRQDLNLRPPAPKAGALPNCATSRFSFLLNLQNLVGPSVSEEKLYITLRKKENRQLKWTFEGFQTGQECALHRKSMNNRSIALISLSFRELELKNAKTTGRENHPKLPPCGFRVLEFEETGIWTPYTKAKNRSFK